MTKKEKNTIKYALVTGGSRGIGRAICIQLAQDTDYHILINYNSNETAANETLEAVKEHGGSGEVIGFNVSDAQQVTQSLETWLESHPEAIIEVIVNNAGITKDGLFMWMKPEDWHNVLNTSLGGFFNVTHTLIQKLIQYHYPYVLLVSDTTEALRLSDQNIKTVVGDLDDPGTYEKVRADRAALIATTANDMVNTNVVFTVRGLTRRVQITATATDSASLDIMKLAGCNNVLRLGEMMGQFLSRRTIGNDAMAHVIGHFDELLIAEAMVMGTPLVGKTLDECNFREMTNTSVVGVWDRGEYKGAGPETKISESTVLVLAGSKEMIQNYNGVFCIYHIEESHVVIIGGGRVGRATARALAKRGLNYKIVEELPSRIRNDKYYVLGSAARLEVLEEAKISKASTVIITTGQDDTNIYLTIYCRKLCPETQIISRANSERNVGTLHRAGADFVASYASMGANIIFNLLKHSDILMVAEGLNVFRIELPPSLENKSLVESEIRGRTGCSVISIQREVDGHDVHLVHFESSEVLQKGDELVLIGDIESEEAFIKTFVSS